MADSRTTLVVAITDSEAATLVALRGEVDLASADQLTRAGADLGADVRPVVLDLEKVTFMDSSGLRALLDLGRHIADVGRPLALLRPSAAVTRLLDLVDLRHRFSEITDVDSASLAALSSR